MCYDTSFALAIVNYVDLSLLNHENITAKKKKRRDNLLL